MLYTAAISSRSEAISSGSRWWMLGSTGFAGIWPFSSALIGDRWWVWSNLGLKKEMASPPLSRKAKPIRSVKPLSPHHVRGPPSRASHHSVSSVSLIMVWFRSGWVGCFAGFLFFGWFGLGVVSCGFFCVCSYWCSLIWWCSCFFFFFLLLVWCSCSLTLGLLFDFGFDVISGFIYWFKKNIEEQVLMFICNFLFLIFLFN